MRGRCMATSMATMCWAGAAATPRSPSCAPEPACWGWAHLAGLVLKLGQHLHPCLCLLGHLLVALPEALDEAFEGGDAPLGLLGVGGRVGAVFGTDLEESVVVAAVVTKPLPVDEHCGCGRLCGSFGSGGGKSVRACERVHVCACEGEKMHVSGVADGRRGAGRGRVARGLEKGLLECATALKGNKGVGGCCQKASPTPGSTSSFVGVRAAGAHRLWRRRGATGDW